MKLLFFSFVRDMTPTNFDEWMNARLPDLADTYASLKEKTDYLGIEHVRGAQQYK